MRSTTRRARSTSISRTGLRCPGSRSISLSVRASFSQKQSSSIKAPRDSQYPFDELSLTAVSRVTLDKSALGFNAGAGVTYYVTEAVGVSFLTRFSQADIEALREGGEPVAFDAGGFRVGGGIRIKF